MVTIENNILILFAVTSLIAFAFPFLKEGVLKQIDFKSIVPSLVPFALMLVPFIGLFAAAGYLQVPVAETLPSFGGAAVLAFLLARINLPPRLRGVLLLVGAVLLAVRVPGEAGPTVLSAALLGLFAAKITDNVLLSEKSTLDDVLPSVFWLSGVLAMSASDGSLGTNRVDEILLGVISVAQLLHLMQGPFMSDDKVLLKRLILATTGGLCALLVINKLMVAVDLDNIALLIGAGFFATYLFKDIDADGHNNVSGSSAVKLLIVIGMLTLVATRFWGLAGLVLLAPTVLIAPRSGLAQFGGVFFASRAFLQLFLSTYNENVTGINLTHPYTGAALYAGFIAIAALLMFIKEVADKRLLLAAYLGAGVAVPLVANYYLHAEPTSSLLVAVTCAGTILSILGPALQKSERGGYDNLILMPPMMISVATTYGALIEAGNSATGEVKATVLAYAVGFLVVCAFVGWLVTRQSGKKTVAASSD